MARVVCYGAVPGAAAHAAAAQRAAIRASRISKTTQSVSVPQLSRSILFSMSFSATISGLTRIRLATNTRRAALGDISRLTGWNTNYHLLAEQPN